MIEIDIDKEARELAAEIFADPDRATCRGYPYSGGEGVEITITLSQFPERAIVVASSLFAIGREADTGHYIVENGFIDEIVIPGPSASSEVVEAAIKELLQRFGVNCYRGDPFAL